MVRFCIFFLPYLLSHALMGMYNHALEDYKTLIKRFADVEDKYLEDYVIPKILFKTGPTATCRDHPDLWALFARIEAQCGYKIIFFDDEQCREVIQEYCPESYLRAYDKVKPNAFKADIFRLVILYLCGGVYADLTQKYLIPPTQYINHHSYVLYLVKDMPWEKLEGIHNAFIAVYPRHPALRWILEGIVQEILEGRRPRTNLDMTGPAAVLRHYNRFFQRAENQALHFNKAERVRAIDGQYYTTCVPFEKNSLRYMVDGKGQRCIQCKSLNLYKELFKDSRHYGYFRLDRMYHED